MVETTFTDSGCYIGINYFIETIIMEKSESLLKIKVIANAPLLVEGKVELVLADGTVVIKENPHLCRCGASNNKPYCDGSHAKIGFKG